MDEAAFDVFLSYARADDEPFVARLFEDLTARGLKVWWDRRKMPSRALTFLQEIRDAIDSCTRMVAVVGPNAVQSDYVLAEWRWASLFAKAVVPVLRRGEYELLPPGLADLHTPDFRHDENYGANLDDLVRILVEQIPPLSPLLGVPRLPLNFVTSSRSAEMLIATVLRDVQRPTPIESIDQVVVLHGMGGIGKSSLAAALARTSRVRRAFEHGTIWVDLGRSADRFQAVLAVGRALDLDAALLATPEKVTLILGEKLKDRRCLIIADDLWELAAIEPLANALGPRCRLLVTTRDGSLATTLTNIEIKLDEFSVSDSVSLLASWVSVQPHELPIEATELVQWCACLPLALALCGAMVREGMPWSDLLKALHEADLTFIGLPLPNYPHRNVYAALSASLDMLARHDPAGPDRFLDLAVFPRGERIPQQAVVHFWQRQEGYSARAARKLLTLLARGSLVILDGFGPDAHLKIHDLQHDFLRSRLGERVSDLHAQFIVAYRNQCEGRWHEVSDDGYIYRRLLWHLMQLGRKDEALALLLDVRWLQSSTTAAGLLSLLRDFDSFPEDADLRLVRDALRLGAKGIAERPGELTAQVRNRLFGINNPRLQSLLHGPSADAWLRTLEPTLAQSSGPLLLSIQAHDGNVKGLAVIHEGKEILSGGKDGRIVVWDAATGATARVLAEGTEIHAMAVSPRRGRWCVVARVQIEVIETDSGRVVARLDVPENAGVRHLAISEVGDTVLFSTWNNTAHVWRIADGACRLLFSPAVPRADAAIQAVGLQPKLGLLITAESSPEGGPGTLRFWYPDTFEQAHQADCAQQPAELAFSLDGRIVASADSVLGARVILTDAMSREIIDLLKVESGYINSIRHVAFSWDDSQLIAGTVQGEIVLWEAGARKSIIKAHETSIECIAPGPGARIVTAAAGVIRLWDMTKMQGAITPPHAHPVSALAFSSNDSHLYCGSLDSKLSIWSVREAKCLTEFVCHRGGVASIGLSAQGELLATGGGDGRTDVEVRLWNASEGSKLEEAELNEDRALAIAVTSDGGYLVVGALFTIHVFKLPELTSLRVIQTGEFLSASCGAVYALALAPNGRAFAGLENGEVLVVDIHNGVIEHRWNAHDGIVRSLTLVPTERLISICEDGTLKIWQTNGTLLQMHSNDGNRLCGGAATADGHYALTSSSSGVLCLWRLDTGTVEATLTFDAPLWPCALSNDGSIAAAGDLSGFLHLLAVERFIPPIVD